MIENFFETVVFPFVASLVTVFCVTLFCYKVSK